MEEFKGIVKEIETHVTGGKVDSHIIRVTARKVDFKPGQYMMIAMDGFSLKSDPSKLKWTPYSIASAPGEELEFVYTIRWTGGFTQFLAEHLKIGSSLRLKGPAGRFVLEESSKEKVFVATGAGIAPLISMIRFLASRNGKAVLFYGFRTGEHFYYRKELESLKGKGLLELHPTISREDPAWKGERGYVQKLLEKAKLEPEKQEVYICGNPPMIKEVTQLLREKGFSRESIRTEQW